MKAAREREEDEMKMRVMLRHAYGHVAVAMDEEMERVADAMREGLKDGRHLVGPAEWDREMEAIYFTVEKPE